MTELNISSSLASLPKLDNLTDALILNGVLKKDDLVRIKAISDQKGEKLLTLLISSGLVPAGIIASTWSELTSYPLAKMDELPTYPLCVDNFSLNFLKQHNVIPFSEEENTVIFVIADPSDEYLIQALELAIDKNILLLLSTPDQIGNAIERIYANQDSLSEISDEIIESGNEDSEDVERLKDLASEAPVVRLVNLLINRAVELRASDIHIEPFKNTLKVRYRVDGVLQEVESPPARSTAAVISRVKIMAKLDIAERRRPQDGRIQLRSNGREIDLRVSTVPSLYGESVVLRILDKEQTALDLISLGFDQDVHEDFLTTISLPHGILLVTGPTGSGKTTTLYGAVQVLNTTDKKIITVEDPVEYQLDGITQIQVRSQVDLTFASALRSVVRQDPDIIMIGEMRDLETAGIAVQAALTGHQVFSTLHTNDAGSAITRLLDMGVQDYLLTSTVNAIIGQRLVRTLCPHCKKEHGVLPELQKQLQLDKYGYQEGQSIYEAVGCDQCAHSGFSGRTIILEFLPISDTIRQLVLAKADGSRIQKAAIEEGMQTMRGHGLKKAMRGETTLEEVLRVTQEI
ncbi:MAG: type II secretion system ATPase GspE [Gammaproteobacteria bacterium]